MSIDIRLLIFGLPRGTSSRDLDTLIQPCGPSRLAVLDIPGDNDQAFAVVQLGSDQRLAAKLATRIQNRRLQGRRLQPWLSTLPWA